eukprot:354551-Chlamydomonas_euryale.AAC.12
MGVPAQASSGAAQLAANRVSQSVLCVPFLGARRHTAGQKGEHRCVCHFWELGSTRLARRAHTDVCDACEEEVQGWWML